MAGREKKINRGLKAYKKNKFEKKKKKKFKKKKKKKLEIT